jgi:hypothetical protein
VKRSGTASLWSLLAQAHKANVKKESGTAAPPLARHVVHLLIITNATFQFNNEHKYLQYEHRKEEASRGCLQNYKARLLSYTVFTLAFRTFFIASFENVEWIIWRSQVLTAASMNFRIVFWDVLPCKIIVDRRFRGTCCLHHQGSQKTIPKFKQNNMELELWNKIVKSALFQTVFVFMHCLYNKHIMVFLAVRLRVPVFYNRNSIDF